MEAFELNAEKRSATGRAENKRLRRSGRIPAIVYGAGEDPLMLTLSHNDLVRRLENEAFFSHIVKIRIEGGKDEEVILRDLQRHPAKPFIEHVDFLRITHGEALRMHVPLHLVDGEQCPGVVDEGGIIQHNLTEVEIECLPRNLPEYIEVACGDLNLNDAVHLSDLKLPEGVQLVDLMGEEEEWNDLTVVSVQMPRAAVEAEDEDEAEAEGDESAEAEGEDSSGENEAEDDS